MLDEQSPIEINGYARDEYAQTKLLQERLIREFAGERKWQYVILRPGVIWGKDNFWTARLGVQAGKNTLAADGGVCATAADVCGELRRCDRHGSRETDRRAAGRF